MKFIFFEVLTFFAEVESYRNRLCTFLIPTYRSTLFANLIGYFKCLASLLNSRSMKRPSVNYSVLARYELSRTLNFCLQTSRSDHNTVL